MGIAYEPILLTEDEKVDLVLRRAWRSKCGLRFTRLQVLAERLLTLGSTKLLQVVGGERAGKSLLSATLFAENAYINYLKQKPSIWWIIGKTYDLPRAEFEYILNQMNVWKLLKPKKGNPSCPKVGAWEMELLDGSTFKTFSSDELLHIAAIAPDGILMAEAAQQTYEVFLRCLGRLMEKDGKMIASGTFEGSLGWYPELYNLLQAPNHLNGRVVSIPTWENRIQFPLGREDPKIKFMETAYADPDLFMERCGAQPCTPRSVVFNKFAQTTHVDFFPYNPKWPLEVAVDPGWSTESAYAVLFIQWDPDAPPGQEDVHVLDELYVQKSTSWDIAAQAMEKPWWPDVEGGTIDVAAEAEIEGNAPKRVWREVAKVNLRCRLVRIIPGIERHQSLLARMYKPGDLVGKPTGRPRIKIHPRCVNLIREHALYKWPKGHENSRVPSMPIDRFNHALKALIYWEMDQFGPVTDSAREILVSYGFEYNQ